jgi:tryptophan-rich sensory protein
MDASSLLMLVAFIIANAGAAATGALFRPGEWYSQLDKPPWRPPDWLFAPVWTALYAMIALSGWLVWRDAGFTGAALPLTVYGFQLTLNAAWTPILFGLRRPDLAMIEIVMVLASILATIVLFHPVSPTAAWLLVPYLAWVSFASALNFSIWRRNPASARPGSTR